MLLQLLTGILLLGAASANFEYAAVCIPNHVSGSSFANHCKLRIIGQNFANIYIHTYSGSDYVALPGGQLYERDFEESYQPEFGLENKAIRVASDVEVQVVVYKSADTQQFSDAYMVPNQYGSRNDYFTSAYYNPALSQCESPYYNEFYLVTSFEDGTAINVTQESGVAFNVQLPAFGTFVEASTNPDNHIGIGTRITSSKPVNVVSGNLCTRRGSGAEGTYLAGVPEVSSLGRQFVVPLILGADEFNPAGYAVTVTASQGNTRVDCDGTIRFLGQGQTETFDFDDEGDSIFVTCSQPCSVTQFAKSKGFDYGMFMHSVLPLGRFTMEAYFNTLDVHPISYVSLVVEGEENAGSLFLNGVSLGYLNWSPSNGYTSAAMSVSQGQYVIQSLSGRPFAMYVYLHLTEVTAGAAGYSFLAGGSEEITPVPTTLSTARPTDPSTTAETAPSTTSFPTTPGPDVPLPQHSSRVYGAAFTSDGQDLTPQCAQAHASNLDQSTKQMITILNGQIGQSICVNDQDLVVDSSKATMLADGSETLMTMEHTLRVETYHWVDKVESCAEEMADYLTDLSNWPQPIFPDVAGCSGLDINPPSFQVSGTFWTCYNQLGKESSLNYISFESNVSEMLSTEDGSSLGPSCTLGYSTEASRKASSMMLAITLAFDDLGCTGMVGSTRHEESILAMGNQAYFTTSFYYQPSRTVTFGAFLTCMEQVHAFSLEHVNWSPNANPGDPFLPVPPGCPALEHDGPTLDDEGRGMVCEE